MPIDARVRNQKRTRLFLAFLEDDGFTDLQFVNVLRVLILDLDPIPATSSIDSLNLKQVQGRAETRLAALLGMGG